MTLAPFFAAQFALSGLVVAYHIGGCGRWNGWMRTG